MVSEHIWDSMVQESVEHVTKQARTKQEHAPHVHSNWMTSTEQKIRQEHQIGEDINRRIWLEHARSTQYMANIEQRWDDYVMLSDVVNDLHDTRISSVIVSDSEIGSENEAEDEE